MRFEWDETKNQANIRKHGIDFRDAAYVFSDPYALNIPDDEHSDDEEHWVLLGKNRNEKILLVVHTFRQGDAIRLISARKATSTEQATYLKEGKKMKEEYDFFNAEQGKFFIPAEDIQIPIYLDQDIAQFLSKQCDSGSNSLQALVNDLLRKDIEIARRVTL